MKKITGRALKKLPRRVLESRVETQVETQGCLDLNQGTQAINA
jgi:hypothetical protein